MTKFLQPLKRWAVESVSMLSYFLVIDEKFWNISKSGPILVNEIHNVYKKHLYDLVCSMSNI